MKCVGLPISQAVSSYPALRFGHAGSRAGGSGAAGCSGARRGEAGLSQSALGWASQPASTLYHKCEIRHVWLTRREIVNGNRGTVRRGSTATMEQCSEEEPEERKEKIF